MTYHVRWEDRGKLRLCSTEDKDTAFRVQAAIAYYWSDDELSVQVWDGLDMINEVVS